MLAIPKLLEDQTATSAFPRINQFDCDWANRDPFRRKMQLFVIPGETSSTKGSTTFIYSVVVVVQ